MTVRATRQVAIPIETGAESLNVAVAAGIVLHALHRRGDHA